MKKSQYFCTIKLNPKFKLKSKNGKKWCWYDFWKKGEGKR